MQTRVEFLNSKICVPYQQALEVMQNRVKGIIEGTAEQALWFLEHSELYTAGTGANDNDLLQPDKFPVHKTGRGGKYTYHGPGQRVAYIMLDLKRIHDGAPDLKKFVRQIENWVIESLAEFDIKGETHADRVGIWVTNSDGQEEKIAAIGIRMQKWVSYHGVAININTNLDDYAGIVPCGLSEHGVTSLHKLGKLIRMEAFDKVITEKFTQVFNVELVG